MSQTLVRDLLFSKLLYYAWTKNCAGSPSKGLNLEGHEIQASEIHDEKHKLH